MSSEPSPKMVEAFDKLWATLEPFYEFDRYNLILNLLARFTLDQLEEDKDKAIEYTNAILPSLQKLVIAQSVNRILSAAGSTDPLKDRAMSHNITLGAKDEKELGL